MGIGAEVDVIAAVPFGSTMPVDVGATIDVGATVDVDDDDGSVVTPPDGDGVDEEGEVEVLLEGEDVFEPGAAVTSTTRATTHCCVGFGA